MAKRIFDASAPAVVQIYASTKSFQTLSTGSGFIMDGGLVVTNAHVVLVDGCESAMVRLYDDSLYLVEELQAVDKDRDIAVLKIKAKAPPTLRIAPKEPDTGERVFAIGNPLGLLRHTISEGIVSGMRRGGGMSAIQTTAPISPGSSGGPLINAAGEVVGITTLALIGDDAQNLNFAMSAEMIRQLLESKPTVQPISAVAPTLPKTTVAAPLTQPDRFVTGHEVLAGLKGVLVSVWVSTEARAAGVMESATKSRAELRLRKNGVPLMSEAEFKKTPNTGNLIIDISAMRATDGVSMIYVHRAILLERVQLNRNSTGLIATGGYTWLATSSPIGYSGALRFVNDMNIATDNCADEFANDYLKANPK